MRATFMPCSASGIAQPRLGIAAQDALRMLGHALPGEAGADGCGQTIGSVQAVATDLATGEHHGAADPRREGTVIRTRH